MRVEDLFKEYYIQLVLYVYRITRVKSVSEDIVQDTFLKLLEQPFSRQIDVRYLYTSVRNRAFNYLRDSKCQTDDVVLKNIADSEIDVEEELLHVQRLQSVYAAIEQLPDACRQTFKEVYLKKRKYAEVAEELGVSLNTVKSHMYMALLSLKKSLKVEIH